MISDRFTVVLTWSYADPLSFPVFFPLNWADLLKPQGIKSWDRAMLSDAVPLLLCPGSCAVLCNCPAD